MKSHRLVLTFNIPARMDFVNITPQVEAAVAESGVREGLALINAMHITASVFINDDEPGLHADYKKWLEQLAPFDPSHQHRRHQIISCRPDRFHTLVEIELGPIPLENNIEPAADRTGRAIRPPHHARQPRGEATKAARRRVVATALHDPAYWCLAIAFLASAAAIQPT